MKQLLHIMLGLLLGWIGLPAYAQQAPALDPSRALTQYILDEWTTEDGLPQGSVSAIAQSHDGYLWLGTQEGLARFDGQRFAIFDKRSGHLAHNTISALLEARDGTLWIGTRGGGLTHLVDDHTRTYTTADGLSSNEISVLLEDRAGTLWVGTYYSGVLRFENGTFAPLEGPVGHPETPINTLYEDRNGALWIGTRGHGLFRYEEGHLTAFTTADGLAEDDVTALTEDPEGTLWIGTRSEGLSRFRHGRFSTATPHNDLSKATIWTLHVDAAGTLWVGTDRGGICRLVEESFTCLTTAAGLAHDVVKAIFEDREGTLWIGTDGGGLNRLRSGPFTVYTTTEGLAHDYAMTAYETPDGAMWIGTESGGLSRFHDGRFSTFTTDDGLAGEVILSLYGTRDGSLWIGTENGLNRLYNGRFSTFTTDDGLPDNAIYALYADAGDNLWLATGAGLVRYREGTFTTFTTVDGLSSDIITAIAEDDAGSLWVGTYNGGLNRFVDGRAVATYSTTNGLESNFVLTIHPDDDGVVWLGTREGGLTRLQGDSLFTVTTSDGLFNDTILQLLEDDYGNLWLSSSRGLFVVNKEDIERYAQGTLEALIPRVYTTADGLEKEEFVGGIQPAGWRQSNGRLWFPTAGGGIATIHPEQISRTAQPPQMVLESATADGESLALDGLQTMLSPGRSRFEFHYVGLSLTNPDKVRYRYKLEGADANWIDAHDTRVATYTNLSPGAYTFKVMARNGDGIWSREAATASFYLQPYFTQTPLFFVLVALGLFLAGFAVYQLRIRHLKRRARELRQLVEARTADLRGEKEKTEEALREARRQQARVQQAKTVIEAQAEKLKEMDQVKTRFFNNISHEFRTPLTLNIGPLENALMGTYGPISDELRKWIEIMLRNSRLLLRLINQLLDVAKLESGRMTLRLHNGNLAELLEGILLSFTAFAERKHLSLIFDAETDDVPMAFDPGHLEKVFFNLVSNAVKFTPENGCVTVSLRAADDGIEVRVTDTGPGIPAHEQPYVFDRFHQVDGTMAHRQEGTGIGLSLAKELVELHGGTIRVESEENAGSTFIVTLPHRIELPTPQTHEGDGALEATEPVSRGPMVEMAVFEDRDVLPDLLFQADDGPAILVVDDNPEIRAYVAGCLTPPYTVITATDGEDALAKARAHPPDLIVSDVMMPKMDGYDFCRAVKADPAINHIPIVLLTSRASLDEKIRGLEAGADDYLTKPFSAEELLVRTRNLLRMAEQQQALKLLNNDLRQTNVELREVSEMKSQLLRIAAHDLKNPLNGIREFAKILKEEIQDASPNNNELLDLIHQSSDQMLGMVSKILDSEALESNQLILHKKPTSARAIAEQVVRQNRPQAMRKGEQLILQTDDDPCIVDASREWLRDAMDNLVSNAIKYSPLNARIWVNVHRHGKAVRFSVRDEGPGLTPDDKRKLFGKFQKLSAIPTSGETSTGLGLSIVKQIVELHGGRVWAESEEGQGSTFIIELTAAEVNTPIRRPIPGVGQ